MKDSAFPVLPPVSASGYMASGYPFPETGITLRDYFAAKAMNGFLSDSSAVKNSSPQQISEWCYDLADAMMECRVKGDEA